MTISPISTSYKKPQQKRSREVFSRILKAAEKLMNEKPIDKISITEIADVAGISVGNFYNRFPDKAAVLLSLYQSYNMARAKHFAKVFAPEKWEGIPLQKCTESVVQSLVDFFSTRRALVRSFVLYYRTYPDKVPAELLKQVGSYSDPRITVLHNAAIAEGFTTSKQSTEFAFQTAIALCREFILFSEDPSKKKMALRKTRLISQVSNTVIGYLIYESQPKSD